MRIVVSSLVWLVALIPGVVLGVLDLLWVGVSAHRERTYKAICAACGVGPKR